MVLRTEPDVTYALRGRELTTTRPGAIAETREIAVEEPTDVLADLSGIALEAGEALRGGMSQHDARLRQLSMLPARHRIP